MFEHYLSNKNEHTTVASNSNFLKLNTALVAKEHGLAFAKFSTREKGPFIKF